MEGWGDAVHNLSREHASEFATQRIASVAERGLSSVMQARLIAALLNRLGRAMLRTPHDMRKHIRRISALSYLSAHPTHPLASPTRKPLNLTRTCAPTKHASASTVTGTTNASPATRP